MKKVIDLSIGRMSFSLEEDAYLRLNCYLKSFERSIADPNERVEVMQDVESRVAEIFLKEQDFRDQVINIQIVNKVISILGEIDPLNEEQTVMENEYTSGKKKIYRDPNQKMLGGICAGLGVYLNIDPTIIRIIVVLLSICYGSGLIIYLILWLIIPEASTISQQLELRGYATTAENIRKFKSENKNV